MRKASTRLLEQGTQPSPAPDLIPAEHQPRTYIGIGTANGGTSPRNRFLQTGEGDGPATRRGFMADVYSVERWKLERGVFGVFVDGLCLSLLFSSILLSSFGKRNVTKYYKCTPNRLFKRFQSYPNALQPRWGVFVN